MRLSMEEAQQQVEKRQRRQGDEEFLPGHGQGGDEGPMSGDGQSSRVEEPGDKIAEGRGRQGAQAELESLSQVFVVKDFTIVD